MNEKQLRQIGFHTEVDRINDGRCPFCNQAVDPGAFRDDLSRKEYRISGLCQDCQDDMFGA